MSYGNVRAGSSLESAFGVLDVKQETRLRDQLLRIDEQLAMLATLASDHVGADFHHVSLGAFPDGTIAGGPSGDPGDLWFEIWLTGPEDAPHWRVSADVMVHCELMPRGYSCLHSLVDSTERRRALMSPCWRWQPWCSSWNKGS